MTAAADLRVACVRAALRWPLRLGATSLLLAASGGIAGAQAAESNRVAWRPCAAWGGDGFVTEPACVRDTGGTRELHPAVLHRLTYAANGTAWLSIDGQDVLVKRDGRSLPVVHVDNGPDDFAEGLVRSPVDGRIGYFDTDFREVIAPTFDFGWPFADGRAHVCVGCRAGEADADGHVPMVGGRWFSIDRSGRELRD